MSEKDCREPQAEPAPLPYFEPRTPGHLTWKTEQERKALHQQLVDQASERLVGSWHGVANSQSTGKYAVILRFDADGRYSGRCVHRSSADAGGGCCSIFNQGIDQDAPFKRWRLTNTYSTDAMQGEIDVAFCDQHRPCYRPGWQGQIRQLRFDVTGRQLRFEFWTDHGFGPVWLDLQRD